MINWKLLPTDLSNLKSKVNKLDVDKLVPVPVDLSKLSDVVKNDIVKKHIYSLIRTMDDKTHDITNLASNIYLNAKINEVAGEIPNITNTATTTALTAVENQIPNVSKSVKKTKHDTKISETENKTTTGRDHDKYITTQEFNKLTSTSLTSGLKKANITNNSDIANVVKKPYFDSKLKDVTSNGNQLNGLSKKGKTISTQGLTKKLINKFNILSGAKYLSLGIFQNYLAFMPAI